MCVNVCVIKCNDVNVFVIKCRSTVIVFSDRPKPLFSFSAKIEYSAAKLHRMFGFGRTFSTFSYFRPKVNDFLYTNTKIGQIRTHIHIANLTVSKTRLRSLRNTNFFLELLPVLYFFLNCFKNDIILTFGFGGPCRIFGFGRNYLRSYTDCVICFFSAILKRRSESACMGNGA
jgi:hypothetical protein